MALTCTTQKLRLNLTDPLTFVAEPILRDLVFQHLTGLEVKNLFAVSKDWNEAAMQSSKAMSKIELKFYCYYTFIPEEDLNLLLRSRRPYQNAVISHEQDFNSERIVQLLKKLSLKLIELELDFGNHPGFRRDCQCQLPSDFEFPLLKKLSIRCCKSAEAHKILAGTSENLKELSIIEVYDFFNVAVPSIKGKLGKLRFTDYSAHNKQKLDNFNDFLMEMSSTLQILQVEYCSPESFEFIITKMPVLKQLAVNEFDYKKAPTQVRNQSITNLVILGFSFPSKNTLRCMPNIETIQIAKEEVIKPILKQANVIKKLKKIEVGWCGKSPQKTYQELMVSDAEVPRDIEIIHKCVRQTCCTFDIIEFVDDLFAIL